MWPPVGRPGRRDTSSNAPDKRQLTRLNEALVRDTRQNAHPGPCTRSHAVVARPRSSADEFGKRPDEYLPGRPAAQVSLDGVRVGPVLHDDVVRLADLGPPRAQRPGAGHRAAAG